MRRPLLFLLTVPLLTAADRRFTASKVDAALQAAIGPRGIAGVVAVVATPDAVLYRGAFGAATNAQPMTPGAVFRIHSMTKAVTSTAAMQLVERGQLDLDAPVERYLPELANLKILTGYDAAKKPILIPAKRQPTLRHLLSHTAGFGYGIWDEVLSKYPNTEGFLKAPLLFEPGTRWQYGTNTDVIGKVVERVSGKTLEEYFQVNILTPLGMKDTTYLPSPALQSRLVARHDRQSDGTWKEQPAPVPDKITPTGGGGLFSTADDYVKFAQMFLRGGQGVLKSASIKEMRKNQIGAVTVRTMVSQNQAISRDFGFHIEAGDKFGLGFQLNPKPYAGGRARNSMAWAGLWNTFYWIDPENKICAVILMQSLPFFDEPSIQALKAFEKSVYDALLQ